MRYVPNNIDMTKEILRIEKFKLTLYGQSCALYNTGFLIPELKLLLDAQTRSKFDPEYIFVTHCHTDHCYSLPMRLVGISTKPLVLVPKESEGVIHNFCDATMALNSNGKITKFDANLTGVIPNDMFHMKNGYLVKVYDMDHSVPCRGYGLFYTKQKLKQEYVKCPKEDIIQLKKQNVQVTETITEPVIAYLTDTTPIIFQRDPELLQFPYIITECTFIDPHELELAHIAKHTHWIDLHPIVASNPQSMFILIHFSVRYTHDNLEHFQQSIQEKNVICAWDKN